MSFGRFFKRLGERVSFMTLKCEERGSMVSLVILRKVF